jgi:hypothetical protein
MPWLFFMRVKDGMASTCDVLANRGSSFRGAAHSKGNGVVQ